MALDSLYALSPSELCSVLKLEKAFQGKQIYSWLASGVTSFEQMTNLSKSLRSSFASQEIPIFSSKVIDSQTDSEGAAKLALRLHDNCVVECVRLSDKDGELTACLSSQVGCAMGCKFCRTGTLNLTRNLRAFEIVEQFMHLSALGGKITHVVFMGMGEPLANLQEVLKAISFLHDPAFLNISHRRITISTCGLVPGIHALAQSGVPVKLAVSLVCANENIRSDLMPVNRTFGLSALKEALLAFQQVSNRRFTFEYCMISGINTNVENASSLAAFCRGLEVVVNLIPFNECPELEFRTPSEPEIKRFTQELEKRSIEFTRRFSRGRSIKGACGQLAGKYQEES